MAVDRYSKEWAYFLLKDYNQALIYLEKAIEKNPEDAEIWFFIGYCRESLGHFQEAVKAYQKVIQHDSRNIWTHFAYLCLGWVFENLDRHEDTIKAYRQAIKIDPENVKAYQYLGWAFEKLKRYEDAIKAYKQAIEIEPKYINAYQNLVVAYSKLNRFQEAFEAATQVIHLNPKSAEAHFFRGFVFAILGDISMALKEYEILKTLNCTSPHILDTKVERI